MLQFLYYVFSFNSTQKKEVSFSIKRRVLEPSPTSQQNSLPQPRTLQHSPSIHRLSTKSRTEWWSALDPATPAPKKLCNSAAVAYQPFTATEGENRGLQAQSGPAVWTTEKPNRERKGKIKFNKETRWPHTLQKLKTIGNWNDVFGRKYGTNLKIIRKQN